MWLFSQHIKWYFHFFFFFFLTTKILVEVSFIQIFQSGKYFYKVGSEKTSLPSAQTGVKGSLHTSVKQGFQTFFLLSPISGYIILWFDKSCVHKDTFKQTDRKGQACWIRYGLISEHSKPNNHNMPTLSTEYFNFGSIFQLCIAWWSFSTVFFLFLIAISNHFLLFNEVKSRRNFMIIE